MQHVHLEMSRKRQAIGSPDDVRGRWPGRWQAGAAKRFRNRYSEQYPRGSEMSLALYGPSYKEASAGQKDARKALRFKGPGDYKSLWKKARKYVPRGVGAIAGYAYGGASGARQGWSTGGKVSKAIGWGDYSFNQITSGPADMNPHQTIHHVSSSHKDLSGDILYSNTEFVRNIYVTGPTSGAGTSSFQLESLPLNPALQATFPFLSQIAQNFELYEFQGLMFQYKPTSGNYGNSNSNALGKVVMTTNYDPDAANFANTIVMENYDYACSTLPSSGCVHGIECKPSQRSVNQMYTRTGSGGKDLVFTDIGNFQIATEGIPFGAANQEALIGELWVTYTVKLSRAKMEQSTGNTILHGAFQGSVGTDFGAKTWSADSNNTLLVSSTTPQNLEIQFVDNSSTALDIVFGPSWQGKTVLICGYSDTTITNLFNMNISTVTNGSVVDDFNAYNGTSNNCMASVIAFDGSYVGTATVQLDTSQAPSGTQIDRIAITLVDPNFSISVNS
jgi:hypothetical protein